MKSKKELEKSPHYWKEAYENAQFRLEKAEEVLGKLEKLAQDRDAYFCYDYADGYFIKLSDKGSFHKSFTIAELKPTEHKDISGAIDCAFEWLNK